MLLHFATRRNGKAALSRRLEVRRFPLDIAAAPNFTDEFTISRSDFSTNRYRVWAAFDLESLERIVIQVHEAGPTGVDAVSPRSRESPHHTG